MSGSIEKAIHDARSGGITADIFRALQIMHLACQRWCFELTVVARVSSLVLREQRYDGDRVSGFETRSSRMSWS